MKKKNNEKYFLIGLFIVITLIGYFFPYTHDDWAWGSSIGIDRLNSLFENYNGRWAGNLLVMLLTRSRLIKALIVSLTLAGIAYYANKIININKNNNLNKYLIILFMLLLPKNILAQAVAWASGFANYVVPVLVVLMYIYFNKNIFNKNKVVISNKLIVPFLLLGFINSLFVEHMTIYNLLLTIGVVAYIYVKEKKFSKANVAYAIGSIFGTILMFSNSAYHSISQSNDGYRTIGSSNIFETAFKTYFEQLYNFLINQNTLINIILCVSILVLTYKFLKTKRKFKKYTKEIIYSSSFIIFGYLSYIIFTKVSGGGNIFIYESYKMYLEGAMIIAYLISLLILTIYVIKNDEKKKRIIFEMISTIIIAAPLLIVTPIGPRCFFPTYIFLIIICCEFITELIKKDNIYIESVLKTGVILFSACLFVIYGHSYKIDYERTKYIEENKNAEQLELPNIIYASYMQYPNPVNDVFKERFKKFYGIDKETEVKFIPYKSWARKTISE